jgi:hypothetical protein
MEKLKFSKEDLSDMSSLVIYGKALGTHQALGFDLDGKPYILADAYCKNPNCDCKSVYLIQAEKDNLKNGKSFFYNYEGRFMEESDFDIPKLWIDEIREDEELNTLFKQRHKQVREDFNERLLLGFGKKIGRNDACPCGSGKKYKKCCGI